MFNFLNRYLRNQDEVDFRIQNLSLRVNSLDTALDRSSADLHKAINALMGEVGQLNAKLRQLEESQLSVFVETLRDLDNTNEELSAELERQDRLLSRVLTLLLELSKRTLDVKRMQSDEIMTLTTCLSMLTERVNHIEKRDSSKPKEGDDNGET